MSSDSRRLSVSILVANVGHLKDTTKAGTFLPVEQLFHSSCTLVHLSIVPLASAYGLSDLMVSFCVFLRVTDAELLHATPRNHLVTKEGEQIAPVRGGRLIGPRASVINHLSSNEGESSFLLHLRPLVASNTFLRLFLLLFPRFRLCVHICSQKIPPFVIAFAEALSL